MLSETTRKNIFNTGNAKIKQKKAVESRLRNQSSLRQEFADLLASAGLFDVFSLLLANAKPSDLRASLPLARAKNEEHNRDKLERIEYNRIKYQECKERNPQWKEQKRQNHLKHKEKQLDKYRQNPIEYKAKKRERAKLWRKNNPDISRASVRSYYKKNKDRLRQYGREYYRKNKDKYLERYASKRSEIIEKSKEYYLNNRNNCLLNDKIRRTLKNREKKAEEVSAAIHALKSAIKNKLQPAQPGEPMARNEES